MGTASRLSPEGGLCPPLPARRWVWPRGSPRSMDSHPQEASRGLGSGRSWLFPAARGNLVAVTMKEPRPERDTRSSCPTARHPHVRVRRFFGQGHEHTRRSQVGREMRVRLHRGPGAQVTPGHGAGTAGAGLSPCRWCPQTQSHFPGRLLASSQPLDTSPGGYGFQERGKQSRRKGPEPPAPGSLNQLRPGLICTSELM